MVGWRVRPTMEEVDLEHSYEGSPTMFSIRLHFGGEFTNFPGRKYIRGKVNFVDLIDIDLFSAHEIDEIMEELGCVEEGKLMYYHFKRPLSDLDFGLFALASDEDVNHLRTYVTNHKLIDVYTEFWVTKLRTYAMSPTRPRVRIQEVVEPPSRFRLLEWTNTASGAVAGPSYETRIEHDVDLLQIQVEATVEPNIEPNIEPPVVDPIESLFEATVEPTVEQNVESCIESDSGDSDFIVDEENMLDDPDVDMRDFFLNIDENVEWVGGTNDDAEPVAPSDEEMEVINTDVLLSDSSSDEGTKSKRRNKIRAIERARKNDAANVSEPFYRFQTFSSAQEVKERIYLHAIESRREIDIVKNDKNRIRCVCIGRYPDMGILESGGPSQSADKGGPNKKKKTKSTQPSQSADKGGAIKKKNNKSTQPPTCPWVLLVSKWKKDDDWTVKTYEKEHRCLQTRKVRACNYKFLSKQIIDQLETNPEVPIRALKEQLEKKYQVGMSDMKVFRAKAKALESIRGDFAGQYAILRDYVLELQSRNPDTTVKIDVESEPNPGSDTRVFKRIYICLGPLKKGFAAGKRDLLGLDGAFMKGPFPGMILTAVGLDGNNCTYPLAYGIVEAENIHSWTWFLTNLGDDLQLYSNSDFTFITDRQKGLLPALAKLFPCAEHRYCLRHIHENMKKKWRGKEFKDALWKCATATTVNQFNYCMEQLKKLNNDTYEWVKAIPPIHWARSHFTGRAHCDALLNNMCEALNSKLVKGRDKPIITCLEFIREYIMKKLVIVQKTIDKSTGPLTPTATATLEKIKTEAAEYRAVFCGNGKYQVTGHGWDQCVVDMGKKTCSCNKWELTGIPCKHTIAAIWDMRMNNETVGIPETWVHPTYWLKTWKEMYSFKVEPVNGRFMWEKSSCPTKLLPPNHHVPIGRPKKKRRRAATEDDGAGSGRSKSVTCSKCGNIGHNGRSCKGQSEGGTQVGGSRVNVNASSVSKGKSPVV